MIFQWFLRKKRFFSWGICDESWLGRIVSSLKSQLKYIVTLVNSIQSNKSKMSSANQKLPQQDPKCPRFLQHSFSNKIIPSDYLPLQPKLERVRLTVPTHQLEMELRQYEWRQKTELPIIKITNHQITQSLTNATFILVELETYPLRLDDLKDLPLFKILYLLKESLIGFERLLDRVGPFEVTPKMIAISQTNKCKVWLNQNLASNSYKKKSINQKEFLFSIWSLFEARANKLKSAGIFFGELSKIESFCQVLTFIEHYARENKLSISNSCKINKNERIVIETSNECKPFDASMTMGGKAPTFLKNSLRDTISHKNKDGILAMIRKTSVEYNLEESYVPVNPEMKSSGDTAADINGSKSNSFVKKEEHLVESLMFRDARQVCKGNETKSILPTVAEKKAIFRKYSNAAQKKEDHCYTPDIAPRKWDQIHNFESISNNKAFLGDDSDEEMDPSKINQLFETNNWQKSVSGLFANDSSLKTSFTQGKQIRKVEEYANSKLLLLDCFGKNMTESHMNEEFDY